MCVFEIALSPMNRNSKQIGTMKRFALVSLLCQWNEAPLVVIACIVIVAIVFFARNKRLGLGGGSFSVEVKSSTRTTIAALSKTQHCLVDDRAQHRSRLESAQDTIENVGWVPHATPTNAVGLQKCDSSRRAVFDWWHRLTVQKFSLRKFVSRHTFVINGVDSSNWFRKRIVQNVIRSTL